MTGRRPRLGTVRLGLVVVLALVGCGGTAPGAAPTDRGESRDAAGDAPTGEVLVSAAASLTDALTGLAQDFEQAHPGTDVLLNLGSSAALREQVLAGAPADVYAAASEETMAGVVEAGAADGRPQVVATNRLQLAVPAANPGEVRTLADLADPELLVGLCAPAVPCGGYARDALDRAGVRPAVDTEEPDVRALLTKLVAGELDAGIVYATDVLAAGDAVTGIDLPPDADEPARYPVVALADAPNPAAAKAFVAFLAGPEGQAALASAGFGPP